MSTWTEIVRGVKHEQHCPRRKTDSMPYDACLCEHRDERIAKGIEAAIRVAIQDAAFEDFYGDPPHTAFQRAVSL